MMNGNQTLRQQHSSQFDLRKEKKSRGNEFYKLITEVSDVADVADVHFFIHSVSTSTHTFFAARHGTEILHKILSGQYNAGCFPSPEVKRGILNRNF